MSARIRNLLTCAPSLLVFATLLGGSPAFAAEQTPGSTSAVNQPASVPPNDYAVKPSDVVLPGDVPLGQYRRIMQPFMNWTLICDENLKKKQKVCNISQSIVDRQGAAAFSWSLAAAEDGRPFFILRVPSWVGKTGSIRIKLADKGADVSVPIEGCDARVCLAYQQVGPRLRAAVAKGGLAIISYDDGDLSRSVSFSAPLEGLSEALAAI